MYKIPEFKNAEDKYIKYCVSCSCEFYKLIIKSKKDFEHLCILTKEIYYKDPNFMSIGHISDAVVESALNKKDILSMKRADCYDQL